MKYFKYEKAGVLLSYGSIDGDISDNCTEITKEEYDKIVSDQAAIDKAAAEERAAQTEAERKVAERAAAERKAIVDDWITKVTAGTSTLADVPDEYRYEVQESTDPTPTTRELHESLVATQDAIDFLITAE